MNIKQQRKHTRHINMYSSLKMKYLVTKDIKWMNMAEGHLQAALKIETECK